MIRLAAFDIDRTLIPVQTGKLAPETREALLELKRRGIKIAISTGRQCQQVAKALKALEFDYYILLNGSHVTDGQGNTLHKEQLDKTTLDSLIHDAEVRNCPLHLRCAKGMYSLDPQFRQPDARPFGMKLSDLPEELRESILWESPLDSGELPMAGLIQVKPEDMSWFAQRYPHLDFIPVKGGSCDVNIHGISKATGLKKICDIMGIGMEEVIAFGDDRNDAEMLRDAGIGVAMGEADDTALAAADYVTDTCEELGVVKALKHFGLLD